MPRGCFDWDADHESGIASFPFATEREAWWAMDRLDLSPSTSKVDSSGALLSASCSGATLRVELDVPSPDSYSQDWHDQHDAPERWQQKKRSIVARAEASLEERFSRAGLLPGGVASTPRPGIRDERVRRMPPTRRIHKRAVTVLERTEGGWMLDNGVRIDAATVWSDCATLEPLPRTPLIVGHTYWATLDASWTRAVTVDVAAVDAASAEAVGARLDALRRSGLDTRGVEPEAFAAYELQYGPRGATWEPRLRALVLDRCDALPADGDPAALWNSLAAILDRRTRTWPDVAAALRERAGDDPDALLHLANGALERAGHPRRYVACPAVEPALWILTSERGP